MDGGCLQVWLGGQAYRLEVAAPKQDTERVPQEVARLALLQLLAAPALREPWRQLLKRLDRRIGVCSAPAMAQKTALALRSEQLIWRAIPCHLQPVGQKHRTPLTRQYLGFDKDVWAQNLQDPQNTYGSSAGKNLVSTAEDWVEPGQGSQTQEPVAMRLLDAEQRPLIAAASLSVDGGLGQIYPLGEPLHWQVVAGRQVACTFFRFRQAVIQDELDSYT